jgi:hypothetical protein
MTDYTTTLLQMAGIAPLFVALLSEVPVCRACVKLWGRLSVLALDGLGTLASRMGQTPRPAGYLDGRRDVCAGG